MPIGTSDRPQIAPLPPIDRARQVTEALASYIDRASLQAGDRLPAERELMAALAVGRSTIREAIRHFQALGVIESRKGSGTYLLKPVTTATVHMPLSFDAAHLRDVLLQTLVACRAGPGGATPHVLLISPAPIEEIGFLGEIFAGGAAKSRKLAPLYERIAVKYGSAFLDAGEIVSVSPTDGIHYEAEQHHRLGKAVAEVLQQRFGA